MVDGEAYPRKLTTVERELLLSVLPEDRTGYRDYRACVEGWDVVAQGRRGEGNYILAETTATVDLESPLPHVVAYGIIHTEAGELSVTVRERTGDQVEFEIVGVQGPVDLAGAREYRRWTLSSWLPSQPCPQCGRGVREVRMTSTSGQQFVLAICSADQRLWVYDGQSGVNLPIPVSNFYNELMLHKNVRDPQRAFDTKRLFQNSSEFTDIDLQAAFRSYNNIRRKVVLEGDLVVPVDKPSWFRRLSGFIGFKAP
jgi:hypothetical protein